MSETTWAPAPKIDSLGVIRTLAAGYCLLPTDDEALEAATAGVRRAIDRLNTRRWNWTLTQQTITFITATASYALNSSFKAPRRLMILDTSGNPQSRVAYTPWTTFLDETTPILSSGTPERYTVQNANDLGTFTLDVPPSAQWIATYPTGLLHYYRRIVYPVNSADVISAPSEVCGFVQEWASGFTADRYAPGKSASAYARAKEFWQELVKDDNDIYPDWE